MTKELYKDLRAKGICTRCRKTPSVKTVCTACAQLEAASAKAYYRANREKILAWTSAYNKANKEATKNRNKSRYQAFLLKLAELKAAPCMDCSVQYSPWVMEFDHRDPTTKVDDISHMRDWNKIQIEVAKCDLVCANCHRERTHKRSNPGAH